MRESRGPGGSGFSSRPSGLAPNRVVGYFTLVADSIQLTIHCCPSRSTPVYRNAKESDAASDASVVGERCGFGSRGSTML